MHLVSDLALGALFFAAGALVEAAPAERRALAAPSLALAGAMLLAMALMAEWEGVASPRFVGHAARELQAHSMLTLPALLAAALALARRRLDPAAAARRPLVRLALALAGGATLWLLWQMTAVDLTLHSSAPHRPWWLNLAVHQFEHLLDLAVLLAALSVWFRVGRGRSARA
jgi:hypothetical protein